MPEYICQKEWPLVTEENHAETRIRPEQIDRAMHSLLHDTHDPDGPVDFRERVVRAFMAAGFEVKR